MIRRPDPDAGSWLLISQVEHARLSGEMAAAWNVPSFGEIEPREALLYAIVHHDDGWPEWEQLPGVDDQGRPINFDEMPPLEALEIWRRSIERCARFDPLAGYAVAGHFSVLLQRFNAWKRGPEPIREAAERFLADCRHDMDGWIDDWPGRPAAVKASADHAVAVLQLFDALSLWLCCQARTESAKFLFPGAKRVEVTPGENSEFFVTPWPLVTDALQLQVSARRVPARGYANREDLSGTAGTIVTIAWTLRPKSEATR